MFFVDAHEDIAYNALEWGRDIRMPVNQTRKHEAQHHPDYHNADATGGIAMLGLPELRQGGFGLVFGTLFAYPESSARVQVNRRYSQTQVYSTVDEAHQVGQQQLSYYQQLAQEPGVSLIRTRSELANLLSAWEQSASDDAQRPFGLVVLMEGADPIRTPEELDEWFQAGLRVIGLAWNAGTRYAGGNTTSDPLTPEGRQLLSRMEQLGMALDTTHLSEQSFWQALEHFQGPVLASHSNCRTFVPGSRQLSDDMLRALIARDGVIGIAPANGFLVPNWSRTSNVQVSLQEVVRHIDHICQLAGNALHVGIGSDIDGGYGRDETPSELDTIADLPKLGTLLGTMGYSAEDVANIMGNNWYRFLATALPE